MKPTYEELEQQLEESRREFRAADATIHNLELKLTDMAVQLANAESKCRELAAFISQSCYVFDGRDADISDSYIDASTSSLMPKVNTKNEGEPCHYCSDGSYSGLPGGACEHCMGTGLDNPAAGSAKGE